MITQLENNKTRIVLYFQPDTVQVEEVFKMQNTVLKTDESLDRVVISPLYLKNKLGVNVLLTQDANSREIQSNVIWPTVSAKSPKGYSFVCVKGIEDLPYQPQEIQMGFHYSGPIHITAVADCLETSCFIILYKGRQ